MDIESLRSFVQSHPEGVRLRMVDGREYDIPNHDDVSFGPARDTPQARRGPHATSFLPRQNDHFSLVNAVLVSGAKPPSENGNGRRGGKGGSSGR